MLRAWEKTWILPCPSEKQLSDFAYQEQDVVYLFSVSWQMICLGSWPYIVGHVRLRSYMCLPSGKIYLSWTTGCHFQIQALLLLNNWSIKINLSVTFNALTDCDHEGKLQVPCEGKNAKQLLIRNKKCSYSVNAIII